MKAKQHCNIPTYLCGFPISHHLPMQTLPSTGSSILRVGYTNSISTGWSTLKCLKLYVCAVLDVKELIDMCITARCECVIQDFTDAFNNRLMMKCKTPWNRMWFVRGKPYIAQPPRTRMTDVRCGFCALWCATFCSKQRVCIDTSVDDMMKINGFSTLSIGRIGVWSAIMSREKCHLPGQWTHHRVLMRRRDTKTRLISHIKLLAIVSSVFVHLF